ncbi:MAG: hypothetical protein HFE86_07940 [Clostridiales bacterium]|nr:hypothetical protein [Clostridiales bacterium]
MDGPERVNVGVGTGAANDAVKKAMEYAYAESAWNLMNPGFNREQGVQTEGDATYQLFYGYDSTGKAGEETGVSCIAGLTAGTSGAYVIANDIFNAWQKTWSDDGKFAATGAPTSAAAIDADGNLRQSFEKVIFVQDKNTGEIQTLKNESAISDFSLGDGVEVVRSVSSKLSATESRMVYIVKDGTDIAALAPTYAGVGVTPPSGSVQDFTGSYDNPIAYVTSPSGGQSGTLYVTVLTESQAAAADEGVLLLKSRLDLLPQDGKAAKTDRSLIVLAKAEYAAMDETQRFLLGDAYAAKLTAAEKALLAEEKDHKLRILCVGSSTTEGVGASSGSFSYPSQLQSLLGTSGYTVINKGVSGTTVADQGGNPYRKTSRYRESLQSNPDLVLIFVGSNDAEYSAWNRSDIDYPAHFRECYVSLLNEYKALDSKPTVVVTYPYRTFGWASRDVLVPDVILPMLTEIAEENDCPILDLYEATNFGQLSENPRDLMPDGLHPNDAGYARIAQAAAQFVGAYTEAGLSELKAGDTAVSLTDGVYEYAVQAAGGYPAVTAKAADPAAKVEITQAAADKPYAEIRVTAGKYTARYRLDFVADAAGGAGHALSADIAKMGRVSYDNLEQFKALRTRYDGLTIAQKAHVRNEYDLGIAELTVNELDVNAQAAKPVIEKIEGLGSYDTPEKTPAVREARASYQTLTAAQQALVGNIGKLIAAEASVPEIDPVYYANEQLGRLGAVASYRDAPVVKAMVPFLESMQDEDKAKIDDGLLQKLEAAKRAVEKSESAFTLTVNDSTWRASGYTKTPWMHNVSAAEKRATADAMADELKYEYVVNGYALGRISGSYDIDSGWGDLPLIQIDGENGSVETDNVTRPWAGQTGRYWAMVAAPFVGMSFSQKGYFASGDTGEAALGNAFSYQGKVYQVYWGSVRSHDDVALEKNKEVAVSTSPSFPGSNGRYDVTNNTFRYAYAAYSQANKWEGGTLGLPAGLATADADSGVTYQAFIGPEGPAYIAGATETIAAVDGEGGKPMGAFVLPAAVAAALVNEAGDGAALFAKMGAPLSDARTEEGVVLQEFEKFDLRVKADGSYTLTPHGQQPDPDFVPGDMDKNGEVTIQDVMEACKVLARQSAGKAPTEDEMLRGDLDGDKRFTIGDVMEICKILARKA